MDERNEHGEVMEGVDPQLVKARELLRKYEDTEVKALVSFSADPRDHSVIDLIIDGHRISLGWTGKFIID